VLTALGAGFARIETNQAAVDRRLDKLEVEVHDYHSCGPDGFLSPAHHGALDAHIDNWAEETFGRRGWRKLVNDYSEPTAK
jgi:hypothetical protein